MLLNSLFKHWSYRLFAPGIMLRRTYDAFKTLLEEDGRSHDLMAEFELLFHEGRREDFSRISRRFDEFSAAVGAMIDALAQMNPADAALLKQYWKKFDFYVRFLLAPPEQFGLAPYAVDLEGTPRADQIGGKAHNLAILKNELSVPVPDGFAVTTSAFFQLIEHNQLREPINDLLARVDIEDPQSVAEISGQLTALITRAEIPRVLSKEILAAYDRLEERCGAPVQAAIRSSAVNEDGALSFAGQYTSVLGGNRETVLTNYLEVAASKYSPEALFYRITVGLSDEETPIAVLVVAMVEAAASGVMYTVDPAGKHGDDLLSVHAVHGLGELLVSGSTHADSFYFSGSDPGMVGKTKGKQDCKLLLDRGRLEEKDLSAAEKKVFSLPDSRALQLARWGRRIESRYGEPLDIEWAVTGDGNLFILQARPLQVPQQAAATKESAAVAAEILFQGGEKAAGGTAAGRVFCAVDHDLGTIEKNSILVLDNTPPSLVRVMDKLAGVVAEQGSSAGHFATVCREFGVPLLVNAREATATLEHGQQVTLDADQRTVYAGVVDDLLGRTTAPARKDLPYFVKLRAIMDFITPLKLVDPAADDFVPSACRSFHDLIRYTHEQAVQAMFSMGDKVSGRSGQCRRLRTDLPLEVYLLDVGRGMCSDIYDGETVPLQEVCSVPFLALWKGLSHPGVDWKTHSHFDWKSFDDITLAGGIATRSSGDFASYAIISRDYLNLNMRFGYHFTLVDALCSQDSRANYCQLRFAGGGGDYTGRSLRIDFLTSVLTRLGLEVTVRADLLDARRVDIEGDRLCDILDQLGRLLGATKLMDMVLKEGTPVEGYVEQFFSGRYDFSGK